MNRASHSRPADVPPLDDSVSSEGSARSSGELRLAFETSIRGGSLAIGHGTETLVAERLPAGLRSAASLIPTIKKQLAAPSVAAAAAVASAVPSAMGDPPRVQPSIIAIPDGPGSFTGLRIAVTAAKTLAYAWDAKLVVVDTLASIAAAAMIADQAADHVQVVANAYRGQVFAGQFDRESLFHTNNLSAPRGKGVSVILASEIDPHFAQRRPPSNKPLRISDVSTWEPDLAIDQLNMATGVAALSQTFERLNDWHDPSALVPRYLKRSAAEESLDSSD